jgi:hypothetical protein
MKCNFASIMRATVIVTIVAVSSWTPAQAVTAEDPDDTHQSEQGVHQETKVDDVQLFVNPVEPEPVLFSLSSLTRHQRSWLASHELSLQPSSFVSANSSSGSRSRRSFSAATGEPEAPTPGEFNINAYGGRGLIRASSPNTLPSGDLAAGFYIVNYDRNPGDVDFFDFPTQIALGLPGNTSFFFSASHTFRTNSVAQEPLGYPVPPLDLFIDTYQGDAQRPGPLFLYAQEAPYKTYFVPNVVIDPPGHGAFASSTGDFLVGGKVNFLSEERDDSLDFGIRLYAEIGTETPEYNMTVTDS